jgi:hypothetical protein
MQPPAKKFTEDEEMKDESAQVQTAQSQIGVQPQQQMQMMSSLSDIQPQQEVQSIV